MSKTIKEIADSIGVSKTAVRKQIANQGLQSSLRKNGNQFVIDEYEEMLILKGFSKKTETENANQTETKTETENFEVSSLVSVLQVTINTLQKQLEIKDHQIEQQGQTIEKLSESLSIAQQTARDAQALHAGTIQQRLSGDIIIEPENNPESQEPDRPDMERKPWWKFW